MAEDNSTPSWLIEEDSPPQGQGQGQGPEPSQPSHSQGTAAPQEVTLNEKSFTPPTNQQSQGADQAGQRAISSLGSARRNLEINQWIYWLRFVNMGACVFCAFSAVIRLSDLPRLATGTLACYVFAFSVIFFFFELQWNFITKIFGGDFAFLFTGLGRLAFIGFTSLLLIILNDVFSLIAGILMAVLAVANLIILCKWPDYTEKNLRLLEDKALAKQQEAQRRMHTV